MSRFKAGLHKNVSSIFNDVPIPDAAAQPPDTPQPQQPDREQNIETETTAQPRPALPNCLINGDHTTQQPAPEQSTTEQPVSAQPIPAQPMDQPDQSDQLTQPDTLIKIAKKIPIKQLWQRVQKKLLPLQSGVSVSTAKQKVMALLIPILFVALIVVLIRVFSGSPPGTLKHAAATTTPALASVDIQWQIPDPYPETLRDPMQFGSTGSAGYDSGELVVRGIVYSSDNPSAVIGTKIVREGQQIAGATVIKINKDNVEFEKDGKRIIKTVQR